MNAAIETKFAHALKAGSLNFRQIHEYAGKSCGVDVLYTVTPTLGAKPERAANEKKKDPWDPIDEDLLVKKLKDYSIVLNKYPVLKYHFLLVTNEFKSQESPLTAEDWTVAYQVLREVNRESGKRHIGFFNCGFNAGASVAHKHIQFVTLPDVDYTPFPDTTPGVSPKAIVTNKLLPFAHYIIGVEKDATGDDIAMAMSGILSQIATKCAAHNKPLNFNLVFTETWIIATPRSKDVGEHGICVNAVGTIGMILARSDEQLQFLEKEGLNVVEDVGFAYEDVQKFSMNDQKDYIQY